MNASERKKKYEEYLAALHKHLGEGLIKVRIDMPGQDPAGETVWAVPIGRNHAKLNNIPFFATEFGLHDIVRLKPGTMPRDVDVLVSRGSITAQVAYGKGATEEATKEKYAAFRQHLLDGGAVGVEGAFVGLTVGIASVAIPTTMPFEDMKKLLDSAPHVVSHSMDDADPAHYAIDTEQIPLDDQL